MKYTIRYIYMAVLSISALLSSCQKWNEVEPWAPIELQGSFHSDEYYNRLLEYKKSPHQVYFTWFSEWTGTGSLRNCMRGLPDSVDIVSMWGGWINPGEARLNDLRFAQQKKGIKALVCFITHDIGAQLTPASAYEGHENMTPEEESKLRKEFWGWSDTDESLALKATEKYANALCDTIDKYHYDGFDMDYEPSYAQPFHDEQSLVKMFGGSPIRHFVATVAKRIGPRSGTGKLFLIDGEPELMPDTLANCFDYYLSQAYGCSTYSDLDYRLRKILDRFEKSMNVDGTPMTPEQIAAKYICTENYESYGLKGGVPHVTRDGKRVKSLVGMAMWNPIINGKEVRKGGCGTFRVGFEYRIEGTPADLTYPSTREAIRIMNPVIE